jgi:hypothetical protein
MRRRTVWKRAGMPRFLAFYREVDADVRKADEKGIDGKV